jgi:hypothetical protein
MTRWYMQRNGKPTGPLSAAELKQLVDSGQLQPKDLVRSESQRKWQAAGRVRGLFPGEIAVTTPPPLPAQQRLAPPGWLRYVHQHWNETKGTLMIPVIAAPFLLLAGSLLKPIIGLSNLAALAAAVGLLSLTTFVAYLAVRTGSYLYGHWIVTEHSTCRLARVAHDTGALAFAVLLPLVLIECPAPERGVLVTAIPKLSRLQHDLIDNRQPLPPFSKWFGNALNAFEGDPGPTPRAFQSRHGQSKLQSQQPQPQGDRERIVLEIANAYAPVLAAMQRENELATLEAQARFKQDMAELVNQPVLWRANVARVERDTVLVVAEDKIYAEADSAFKIRAVFLPQGVATTDHINWAASRIPPWVPIGKNSQIVIGEGCDETTARNLSKGQTVLIQGEISGYNDDHCLFITNSRIVSL